MIINNNLHHIDLFKDKYEKDREDYEFQKLSV